MKQRRVAIICYSYSDGFAYMEQKLAQSFYQLGMKVLVICSTANRIDSSTIVHVRAGEYDSEGYSVCRLPFITGGHLPNHRMPIILKGMYSKLESFEPDIIYHMSCSAINLLSVLRYMKKHSNTDLYVDNHATLANSANNIISKTILHKMIYKTIIHKVDQYIKKYFYVGNGEKEFLEEYYCINKDKCFFFSLGDFVPDDNSYSKMRKEIRVADGMDDRQIVITCSGKFTKRKRTIEILSFMRKILEENANICFYLIGSVQDESISKLFNELVDNNQKNFKYLGWKNSEDLKRYLCATDIYIQYEPSSTFQTALCCRAFGITGNVNHAYDVYPDGIFTKVDTIDELEQKLREEIYNGNLQRDRERSFAYAGSKLDYIKQVQYLIIENV